VTGNIVTRYAGWNMKLFSKAKQLISGLFAGAATPSGGSWHSLSEFTRSFRSLAGIKVNEKTAMSLSAYYACIRCVAEDVAKLPLITYKRLKRGKERAPYHYNYDALHDSPNPYMTALSFREAMTHWALGWGNGYAEIVYNARNVPELYPIHPSRVRVKFAKNELIYEVKNDAGVSNSLIPQSRMLHIHGLGNDGLMGYSVLRFASESVGLGLAAQSFGAAFFGNGANAGSVLEYPGELSEKGHERLRKSWADKYEGVKNSNKPIILEHGAKFNRLAIPPNEAQFLETREFSVEDICRWFRVPPQKVQYFKRAQGWSTLDAQNTDYVTDTLLTWLVRWEQEIKRKLFAKKSDYYAEHLLTALLRGDMKTRAAFYRMQFMNGAMSVNDIRAAENQNPVDGGDVYFVPVNMTPLHLASQPKGTQ